MPGQAPVHGPLPAKGSSQRVRSPLMPAMGAKELEGAKSPNRPGFGQNCPTSSDWPVYNNPGLHTGKVVSARPTVRELSPPPIPGSQRPAALRVRQNSFSMPGLPPTSGTPSVPQAARGSLQGSQHLLLAQNSPQVTNVLQTPQSPQAVAVTAAAGAAAAAGIIGSTSSAATMGSSGSVRRFSSGPDCLATSRSRLMTAPSPAAQQQHTEAAGSQKIVGGYAVPNRRRVRSHGATARVSFDESVVTKTTTADSLDKADDWEAQKDAEIAQAVDVERRRASQIEAEKNAEIEELRRQLATAEMRAQQQPAHAQQDAEKAQESASNNSYPAKRSTKSFIRLHLEKFTGGAGVAHEVSLSDDGTRCKLETSLERKEKSAELFKALDTTGTSLLGSQQLLPLAELIGFEGTDEEWVQEYNTLSQRYGWDPQIGAGKEEFTRMVDDEGSSAHLDDFELRLLKAELESHHEEHIHHAGNAHAGNVHDIRSRSSSMHSNSSRRKSVYENGHPHRRKSMVAKVNCDSGYGNEY